MQRRTSIIAGVALVAVGAVLGSWITAETNHSVGFSPLPVAAQVEDLNVSFENGFKEVVKKVQPAVVSIMATQNSRVSDNRLRPGQSQGQGQIPEEFFRFFGPGLGDLFGGNGPMPQTPRQGLGSGVIMTDDGYIVTNNHVVEDADEVKVMLNDRREFDAEVVGTDPETDLAVLKIAATGLHAAQFGDSQAVEVGDIVLAMGNPFGIGQTVTMGIVGATGRGGMGIEDYEDFIQTDAAINPGNSGGALVNVHGQVVGINTAIISRSGSNAGVGFAIPEQMARNVMEQIMDHGTVTRGYLGVMIQGVTPQIADAFELPGTPRGALISDVNAGSPAEDAGLERGDIVLAMNGVEVADNRELRLRVADLVPESQADFRIFRDGAEQNIAVTIGERPTDVRVAAQTGNAPRESSQLGVRVQPVNPQVRQQFGIGSGVQGLAVIEVDPGSSAAEAGLQPGDVIIEANREAMTTTADLQAQVRDADGSLLLLVNRDGNTIYITVEPR